MAYVRKAERPTVVNETGIDGIEDHLTTDELTYCNNLAKIWKNRLEIDPQAKMVKVGTWQGLYEMGTTGQQHPNVTKVLLQFKANNLLVAHGYVIVFGQQ